MTFALRSLTACSLIALATLPLAAQSTERAVFMVRLGRDTLAVETATFTPRRAESMLRLRTPLARLDRRITFSPAGELQGMEFTAGMGVNGDSNRTHSVVTVTGDSARQTIEVAGGGLPQQRTYAVPRGAVPFTNLSGQTLELALRRARATGRDTADVPLLLPTGQTLPVRITRLGRDSAVLSLAGVAMRVHTDDTGRFLGAYVPSQGATFERLPGDSPVAAWMPVRPNYDAPPGAPYTAEQVTLRSPAGITLAGTLTVPRHAAASRVPAVVLITGSGAQDRDESIPSIGSYHPFREIADSLTRRGIAVLRLDDRGVGGSDAGPSTATSADFADDIRAALAWLRGRADVDPARLGLVGHSEGGLIAPMIAATDPALRAIALVAAPAKSGRAISAMQRRWAIDHDPAIPRASRDSLSARSDIEVERAFAPPGWLHFFAAYDPLPTARRVRTRTLILQGETDRQVTMEQAAMLADAMRQGGNRNVTLRTFPRMNHLMLDDASGDPAGYQRLSSYEIRRDFLGALVDWLGANL